MRSLTGLGATAWLVAALASAQNATPVPSPQPDSATPPSVTPTPAARGALPVPSAAPPLRLSDPPVLSVESLPTENPFASAVDAPATPPVKPVAGKAVTTAGLLVTIRVDPRGKAVTARRVRDPIPSVSAESQKSFTRWTFDPGRKAGQAVETWASLRLDLSVEIDSPRIEQFTLTPITPSTPIAAPLELGTDAAFLDQWKPPPPPEGAIPNEQLDTPPAPKKTPWSADYKGPFSVRFWIKINGNGKVERAIPIHASDPILIGYFRKAIDSWLFRPARAANAAATSWNELTLGGQISYSAEIRQIASLRRSL